MKIRIFSLFSCFCIVSSVFSQSVEGKEGDRFSNYFEEIKTATKNGFKLWNKDLYGSILLVDPKSRTVISNDVDAGNTFKKQENIYIGVLPKNINIANTAVKWEGKEWAMLMLPLPENTIERLNLATHELFHKAQKELGFNQNTTESNHLDTKDGRIYLRLELQALTKAIASSSKKEQQKHLYNAFVFRNYRNLLFEGSAAIENQLELNEGIAEYTGFILSGRNLEQTRAHFKKSTEGFLRNPTYVRSFAYITIPMYGFFAQKKDAYWNQKITADTQLIDFFSQMLTIRMPKDIKSYVERISQDYNGVSIAKEEDATEKEIKRRIAEYKAKFIEQPHFEIRFEKMNVSFDPRNIMPLEDKGTVYPNLRLTDNWGVLEVTNGALMSPNWDKLSLGIPTIIEKQKIEGDGWTLQLNDAYVLKKEDNQNYILVKK